MKVLETLIEAVSPEWALKRAASRARLDALNNYSGGYGYGRHGASYGKKSLIGWQTSGMSADEDIVDNVKTLRERSRDLYMGVPLATGAIKTIATNVVGSGISLSPQIDAAFLGLSIEEAQAWEANVQREFELWAETVECDAERRQNFYQIQRTILLSALCSGDVFVILPIIKRAGSVYDLRIGLIEADRVCNPEDHTEIRGRNIAGGIEVGEYGETLAVWVAKYHPYALPRDGLSNKQEWKRVQAFGAKSGRRNILHVMCDVERPAQRRGVPILAPVMDTLKNLGRYSDAEIMAAVVSAMFTAFVKSENQTAPLPLGQGIAPGQKVDRDPISYELGNATVVELEPGRDIVFADPKRPNNAFEGFVEAICEEIGSALELPYELLIKHFESSYSASRASLLEAWKMFRMRREWLISGVCQPIYEEWLSEAVAKGRVNAPGFFDDPAIKAAWCGAGWYGDSQGQLDPLKEANAAKVRVEEGFSTRERETAELSGMQYRRVAIIRAREEAQRRADGWVAQAPAPVQTEKEEVEDED